MTVDREIEVLMTEIWVVILVLSDAPYKCLNDSCEFKETIHLAVEILKCETCKHWWKSEEVCLLDDCQYEPLTDFAWKKGAE